MRNTSSVNWSDRIPGSENSVKLVIFSHFFLPKIGGVEKQVLSLAHGLAQYGNSQRQPRFEVTVITNTPTKEFQEPVYPFEVVRCPNFYQLWRLILRADVLHLAGPALIPLLIARLLGKPTVIEHHGYQSICPNGILIHQPERSVCPGYFQAKRYVKCLKRQACEMPLSRSILQVLLMAPRYLLSRTVTANIAITDHVLQRHALPSSERIYYGIDDQFSESSIQFPDTQSPNKFCIAFVGRLVPEKGIPVLLDAVSILNAQGFDVEVRLIGDGPQRQELEELIAKRQLKDRVRILGYVSGLAMAKALRGVNAVVVPSVWEEAAGFSAIEQMMNGRLVIASAIGGLKEIVGDGGLLFPAGDAMALASHLRTVLHDPVHVESITRRARARALQLFKTDRMIWDHVRLYSRLVKQEKK